MDEASAAQANTQLAGISSDTSRLTNGLKSKIKILEQQNARLPPGGDTNVRRTQVGAVKNRFMESIQRYQQVEQTYRQKYRQRAERQFRIVKPDATPQEVKAALDDDQGGQIFSQALLNSNRHGEARGALREVQERHEDIKKIERTITELAQLFNEVSPRTTLTSGGRCVLFDRRARRFSAWLLMLRPSVALIHSQMSILVEQQDDSLNVIETHAVNVETDMQAG